jgi:hypothetical protein
MQTKQNNNIHEIVEVLALSFLCLFVGYLLFTELSNSRRCIPDLSSQTKSSC